MWQADVTASLQVLRILTYLLARAIWMGKILGPLSEITDVCEPGGCRTFSDLLQVAKIPS